MIFSTVALEDLKRAGVTSRTYLMFKPAKLAELVGTDGGRNNRLQVGDALSEQRSRRHIVT